MKLLIIFLLLSFSTVIHADSGKDKFQVKKEQSSGNNRFANHPTPLSSFDIIPLNSPVKESVARFLIKVPNGFEIDDVRYKIRNANHLFAKDGPHHKINLMDGVNGKELQITVSKLPPGFYQLFVKIRDRKNKEHEYKTQYKNYAMFVVDSTLEVPMPNEKENNKTVAGIDFDGDGIRDDVQRWINETFSNQPDVKLAMRQMAMARQSRLLYVANREQSIITVKKTLDSSNCLRSIIGTDPMANLQRELNARLLNSKDRLYADIKASSNFSGQAYELPSTTTEELSLCDFETNAP